MDIYEELFRDSTWTIHQHLNGLVKVKQQALGNYVKSPQK
jgi:hypothetical protein